ncbi:MAG: GAF domain-containing protein, partial [Proteocatella sp.]|nr:GAF domain-containing protein [Proteocatella sp.]
MLNISYRSLIDKSPVGYALHEIICNSDGEPCDYIFIEANAAFEKFTGLSVTDIKGKKISEILPYIKSEAFDWISFYGNIALNGGEEEFQQYSGVLGRWYTVNTYSPEKNYFVTFFTDITENLSKQSKIQDLLYEISTDFVNVKTEDIEYAIDDALEKMGNATGADRVYIFRYDFERNSCSNIYEWCSEGTEPRIERLSEISLDLIPEWVQCHISGNTLFVNDESELRYIEERKNLRLHEIKSLIAVPVTYDNRLYGFAGFNSIKNSYHYSELEQNLLQNFGQLLLSLMLRKEIEDSVYIKKEIFRTTLLSIADGV